MVIRFRVLLIGLVCLLLENTVTLGRQSKVTSLANIPQRDVNCLFLDSKGFMWIGTLDGLHRYDGYGFKTYQVENGKNSITSNLIIGIDEDSRGNLWIATYDKGICRFNPKTEKFRAFKNTTENSNLFNSNDITCMMIDDKDIIWTGNWLGFHRITFDPKMEHIIDVKTIMPDLPKEYDHQDDIKDIYQHDDGSIWISANHVLLHLRNPYGGKADMKFDTYPYQVHGITSFDKGFLVGGNDGIFMALPTNSVKHPWEFKQISTEHCIKIHYLNGSIWYGNRNGAVELVENSIGTWIEKERFSNKLQGPSLSSNIVTAISHDLTDQIWIGSRSGGVDIISNNTEYFATYSRSHKEGSLSSNLCRSIFEDHNENLWIGTEDAGLNFLSKSNADNYESGFTHIDLKSISDPNWVNAIEEVMLPNSKVRKSLVYLGTGHPSKITAIDPTTFEVQPTGDIALAMTYVFALENVDDSVLWAGTYGNGLYKLSLDQEGKIVSYQEFLPDKNDPNSISSLVIRSLLYDNDGYLWIGTDKGLNRIAPSELHKKKPKFRVYAAGNDKHSLTHDYILQITQSKDGGIWIGTMGGGLLKFVNDGGQGYFEKYTKADGLPNNAVKTVVADNYNHLWLGTNNGLSKFDIKTKDIVTYDASHGLQDKEFSEICGVMRKNGQVVIGGIKGFNVFYPNQLKQDTVRPILYLTDLWIHSTAIKPGMKFDGDVVLPQALTETKEIVLKNRNNSFSIGFVALQYHSPQKNKYAYKLEGFDKVWRKAAPEYRRAEYTNIPPGKYTFVVKGQNGDNIEAKHPVSLVIRVKPPFYLGVWAYLLYILVFVVGGVLIRRSVLQREKRRKELLLAKMEQAKTEEIAQMKLQFFTNISHEFRTPLTLINAPLISLLNHNADYSEVQRMSGLQLIQQNVNVMMRLINQVLDFRKMDRGKMKLRCNKHDVVAFVEFIYNSFAPLAVQNQIDFKMRSIHNMVHVWFDSDKIEKVLYNLLSNAFKFTPKDGFVEMGLYKDEDNKEITIYVKDSGSGIADEDKDQIFERYYQKGNTHSAGGGTGIGLALSKELVEMHHGKIYFESNDNDGAIFYVKLPLGDAHLKDENKDLSKEVNVRSNFIGFEGNSPKRAFTPAKKTKEAKYKKTILLVEDNTELRNFMQQRLSEAFNVLCAENGVEGLNVSNSRYPDLVVSDIMMPLKDGYQLCSELKQNEATSHIPVILLTAKSNEESQIKGFDVGADSYLSKPFNPDVLEARITSLINNRILLHKKFQREMEINPSIVAKTSTDERFMTKIISIVERNVADSNFSVEQLATEYGVSRIYLNRKIKAITGETCIMFIRNIRLKLAANLMLKGEYSISEITWMVGYNDLRTFRSRFKEKFGMSPSEYMKSVEGK